MANISPPMRGPVFEAVQEAAHQRAKERTLEGKGRRLEGKADSGPSKGKGKDTGSLPGKGKGKADSGPGKSKGKGKEDDALGKGKGKADDGSEKGEGKDTGSFPGKGNGEAGRRPIIEYLARQLTRPSRSSDGPY